MIIKIGRAPLALSRSQKEVIKTVSKNFTGFLIQYHQQATSFRCCSQQQDGMSMLVLGSI